MIKTLGLAIASLGLASAQSWSDSAGVCKAVVEPKDFQEENQYWPKQESIAIDDQSLSEMVFEFDGEDEASKSAAKCFYFTTQVIPGKTPLKSDRYCVDQDAKDKGDQEDGGYTVSQPIPLWNVEKIETTYLEQKIVDMYFTMRYTNVTDPKGYYQYDNGTDVDAGSIIEAAVSSGELDAEASDKAKREYVISQLEPQILTKDGDTYTWKETSWADFTNVDGSYLQKFFNVSMIKYNDTIGVKLYDLQADEVTKLGCAVDILAGSTIKGSKFFSDADDENNLLSNIAFRLQPIEEYYDTTHSYSQNGDIYSVGYDNDFYDGKIEYTANGYSPQSVQWKLSRSLSTSVLTSALTIAGALIGSWAF